MSSDYITVLCYWNGRITSCSRGVSFEGATPKPVRVSNRISYSELVDMLYGVTGFNRLMRIKIDCRYPVTAKEYILVPVENTDSLSAVLDVTKLPEYNCLELYLEAIPITRHDGEREVIDLDSDVEESFGRGRMFSSSRKLKDEENSYSGTKIKRENLKGESCMKKNPLEDEGEEKNNEDGIGELIHIISTDDEIDVTVGKRKSNDLKGEPSAKRNPLEDEEEEKNNEDGIKEPIHIISTDDEIDVIVGKRKSNDLKGGPSAKRNRLEDEAEEKNNEDGIGESEGRSTRKKSKRVDSSKPKRQRMLGKNGMDL